MVSAGDGRPARARASRLAFWATLVIAVLGAVSMTTADVWDTWDYPGKKRTLKIWVRNGDENFKKAVKAAIDNWNTGDNNGEWTLEEGTEADHDVDVGSGKIDGKGGTLGEATVTKKDGVAQKVSITIDNQEDWGDGAEKQNLERTIKHELGHAQRMDDTDQAGDIMNGHQGVADDNLEPSQHDKDEAKAAHGVTLDGFDILPESLRKNRDHLCSIVPQPGVDFGLANARTVQFTALEPIHLQIYDLQWGIFTGIEVHIIPTDAANHNEACFLHVLYRDGGSAQFTGIATINPVDPPEGMYPHAVAGPDFYAYAGHNFTLHGCESYHDDAQYTSSLVHIWKWAEQPNLPEGTVQSEMHSTALPVGVYNFDLEVEDLFGQKSVDSVQVTVVPYPPPGADCTNALMDYELIDPLGNSHRVRMRGNNSMQRSPVADLDGDGLLDIALALDSMELSGVDPILGPIRLVGTLPSPGKGQIEQLEGGNWSVDSFFDITYRIDFVGASQPPLRCGGERQEAHNIPSLPFDRSVLFRNVGGPVRLLNEDGTWSGWWGHCDAWSPANVLYPEPLRRVDCMDSIANAVLIAPDGTLTTMQLEGPTVIRRNDWSPVVWGDRMAMDTEMVAMDLRNAVRGINSPNLLIRVSPDPPRQSVGKVLSQTPGVDFPADSFFDVFVEIELPDGSVVHNCAPIHLQGPTSGVPFPVGTQLYNEGGAHLPLLDETGDPTGWSLWFASLQIGPVPIPYPDTDCFGSSARVKLSLPDGVLGLSLQGPVVVKVGDPGTMAEIPIEIVALSLTSTEPITVTLKESPQRASRGLIVPTDPSGIGGTFDSTLPVMPVFVFTDKRLVTCEPVTLEARNIPSLPPPPGTTFSMQAATGPVQLYLNGEPYGMFEDMSIVLGDHCTDVSTPAEAKQQPEGSPIHIEGPRVSSFFDVFFYIEDPARSSGMHVAFADGPMPQLASNVHIVGTAGVADGEARIDAAYVEVSGSGEQIKPLGIPIPRLGGAAFGLQPAAGAGVGLSNIGLFVRTAGWLSEYLTPSGELARLTIWPLALSSHTPDSVTLDFAHTVPPVEPPPVGEFVTVTGALGATSSESGAIEPVIHVVSWESVGR